MISPLGLVAPVTVDCPDQLGICGMHLLAVSLLYSGAFLDGQNSCLKASGKITVGHFLTLW